MPCLFRGASDQCDASLLQLVHSCLHCHFTKRIWRLKFTMMRTSNLIGMFRCAWRRSVSKAGTSGMKKMTRNVHSSIQSSASKAAALPDLTLPTYVYEGHPQHINTHIVHFVKSSPFTYSQLFARGFVFDKVRHKSEQGCKRRQVRSSYRETGGN